MRYIQHKKEAYWFYRFLSIFYDRYVNPFFWTRAMRGAALELAQLDRPELRTIDVGSGTGFTTQGIVECVDASRVTCIDQSPHQMAKAKGKADLRDCTFELGDAEALSFPDDHFERYVSAGSIEYWPDPQRGIAEAYRVVEPGGVALVIGPLRPRHWLARRLADTWMLFPEEEDYRRWFEEAGFAAIQHCYIAPSWVRGEPYAIAMAGTKKRPGKSPLALEAKPEEERGESMGLARSGLCWGRLLVGSVAGFAFIKIALWGYLRLAGTRLAGMFRRS